MAKKIYSVWRLLLGSLIALLGFAACKTTKKTQQEKEAIVLYGAPPAKIDKQTLDPIRLLYGVPPVKVEKAPELN